MIYPANSKGAFKVPGYHDKDSKRLMGIIFRPSVWEANKVYYRHDEDNYDIVVPAIFTGVYYKAVSPGKSGATEPSFIETEGGQTADSTTGLIWESVNYNLMIPTESVALVTFSATHGVMLTNTSYTSTACYFMIDTLPTAAITAKEFEIDLMVTKNNDEKTPIKLTFKVK